MASGVINIKNIGEVTFYKNRRSTKIKISVKPDKSVLVSFPYGISEREVLSFIKKSEDWILRQKGKLNGKIGIFTEGLVIETKMHSIHLFRGNKNNIEINGNRIDLTLPDFDSEQSTGIIKNLTDRVYRKEAKQILPGRLKAMAVKYGFSYNKVTLRNNKSNWGSCSSKNNISLNLQLMKLPFELIDYILLHELVHTEIKNHGPRFWERLNQVTEFKARQLSAMVRQFSTYTI